MFVMSAIAVTVVAALHLYFMVLEMFLWDKPTGLKAFGNTPEKAAATKVLAANQGLYNGFIGIGLLWGVIQGAAGYDFKVYFLLCVIAAGIYGAISASRKILLIQALPGALALLLVVITPA